MPIDYSLYPPNWKAIRQAILDRAGNRCECVGECGLHQTNPGPRRCVERHLEPAIWARGRVVLTIAHLPEAEGPHDGRPELLKAMCQRCHLRMDRELHAKNAADTRRRRKVELGQMELLA